MSPDQLLMFGIDFFGCIDRARVIDVVAARPCSIISTRHAEM